MKVNIEELKHLQELLAILSKDGIDLADKGDYLSEDEYDELPDEMEIDEIRLFFPDDQDVFCITPEDFLKYMEDLNTIRQPNEIIVRTDHIIQAKISSIKVGYTGFEEKITSYTFTGDKIKAEVIKSPFLIGVMNARKGHYDEDFGLGACEPYSAIELQLEEEKDERVISELIEQICFYLTDITGVSVYPWEGPNFEAMYDGMDEYYGDEDTDANEDSQVEEIDILTLPKYSPLLKMYRQAKGASDAEIQFLQYYKMMEYVSPLVAKKVAYEHLNKRLDLLPRVNRDQKYLDSILSVARKYDKDLRDDSLVQAVMENCVDVVPLYEMLPQRMLKKVKATLKLQSDALTDEVVNEEQIHGLQKQIAAILYSTRNSIVHAKSNYQETGQELLDEELDEVSELMDVIARSIINWNERQGDGFRV